MQQRADGRHYSTDELAGRDSPGLNTLPWLEARKPRFPQFDIEEHSLLQLPILQLLPKTTLCPSLNVPNSSFQLSWKAEIARAIKREVKGT
jgi:hypothetical protein